ncbi:MAG: hypothetical protein U0271_16300 [Polyangiaceae bacterium]
MSRDDNSLQDVACADLQFVRSLEADYDVERGAANLSRALAAIAVSTGAAAAHQALASKGGTTLLSQLLVYLGAASKPVGLVVMAAVAGSLAMRADLPPSTIDAMAPAVREPLAVVVLSSPARPHATARALDRVAPSQPTEAPSARPAVVSAQRDARRAEVSPPTSTAFGSAARSLREMSSLARSDPARALELAERDANPVFAEEREIVSIRALLALGRVDEARTRAQTFLNRHPKSPFAATARSLAHR